MSAIPYFRIKAALIGRFGTLIKAAEKFHISHTQTFQDMCDGRCPRLEENVCEEFNVESLAELADRVEDLATERVVASV